mgnify:FL=1
MKNDMVDTAPMPSSSKRRFIQMSGVLAGNLMICGCGGSDISVNADQPTSPNVAPKDGATLHAGLTKALDIAGPANLALLAAAVVTGSATGGQGVPRDILYDTIAKGHATTSNWAEYGVALGQTLGLASEAQAFWRQVAWSDAKTINTISFGGAFANQPQAHTRWKIESLLSGAWTVVSQGVGGWLDGGVFVWGKGSQRPIQAQAIRMKAQSDGGHPLLSIHLCGRGGQSVHIDDRNQSQQAVMIQYLASNPVVNVLFDTDIGPDCDNTGTLAVLHALADLGKARILGVGVTVSNPWSATPVDAINTWYRRPDLPIGTLQEPGFLLDSPFTETVAKNFPNDLQLSTNAPDALAVHHEALAAEPNGSVTLVAVGPLRNLPHLLYSPADAVSSLSGRALIAAKVKTLVVLGGRFPNGREWSIEQDPASAQAVVDGWPTDIVFSGGEVGDDIGTGYTLSSNTHLGNPVRRACEIYVGANQNRPSWDQTALFFAVRGTAGGLCGLSEPGKVAIAANGNNSFASSAAGRHRYMVKVKSDADVASSIEALMIRAPQ